MQHAAIVCEVDFNDHFSIERFEKLDQYRQQNNVATREQAFKTFSALAYSRMLAQQESLKAELLDYIQS